MEAMTTCPNCGCRLHERSVGDDFEGVHFPEKQRRILKVLVEARGGTVPFERLVDAMYYDHPDGGPEYAKTCLGVRITHMRKVLKPLGYQIFTYKKVGYWLEKATQARPIVRREYR